MALTTAQIQQAYVTFFNRPADVAGLNYWSSYGGTIENLYATFAQSAEYTAAFDNLTNMQKVNAVYNNLFGRDGDLAGLAYWTLALDNGSVTLANLALALQNGAQGSDVTILANKVTAATNFTEALDTADEALAYSGDVANQVAKDWLSGVTDDASLAAAIDDAALAASVAEVVGAGVVTGDTFSLTTDVDALDLMGGNDADVVKAVQTDPGEGGTLNTADVIQGNGHTIVELTLAANDGTVDNGKVAEISDVAAIDVKALSNGTIQASGFSNVESINLNSGINGNSVFVDNLEAGTRLTVADVSGTISASYDVGGGQVYASLDNNDAGGDGGSLLVDVDGNVSVVLADSAAASISNDSSVALGDVTVSGGNVSDFDLYITAGSDQVVGDVNVTLGNTSSVSLSFDNVDGDLTVGDVSLTVGNSSTISLEAESVSGDITFGDVSLVAGDTASISVSFTDNDGSTTMGDLNIEAGTDATIDVLITTTANASGDGAITLGDFSVAMGDSSSLSATVEASNGDVTIGDISVVGGNTATADIYISADSTKTTSNDLHNVVVGNVTVALGDGGASSTGYASVSIGNYGNNVGDLTVGDVDMSAGDNNSVYFFAFNSASAATTVSNTGTAGGSLVVGDVVMAAGSEVGVDTNTSEAEAQFYVYNSHWAVGAMGGDVTVGDVSVSVGDGFVSGTMTNDAVADVTINNWGSGGMGDLTVGNVSVEGGDFADLNVSVTGYANAAGSEVGNLALGNLSAVGGESANLYVDVLWEISDTGSLGDLTVGNVDVSVKQDSTVDLNFTHSVTTSGTANVIGNLTIGDVMVLAGDNADIALSVSQQADFASGTAGSMGDLTLGDISVAVSATTTDALSGGSSIDINIAKSHWNADSMTGGDLTVGNVNLSAGDTADISFDVNFEGSYAVMGDLTVGDLTLNAGDNSNAYANLYVSNDTNGEMGAITLGNVSVEVGDSSAASVTLDINSYGNGDMGAVTVGDVSLVAGDSSTVTFSLSYSKDDYTGDLASLTLGDVTMTAGDGTYMQYIVAATSNSATNDIGDVTLGDLTVTLGESSTADYTISITDVGDTAGNIGHVTVGNVMADVGFGSSFNVDASFTATSDVAGADIGSISLDVAEAGNASVYFNVYGNGGNAGDMTVGDISLALADTNTSTTDTDAASANLTISLSGTNTADTLTVGNIDVSVAGDLNGDEAWIYLDNNSGDIAIGNVTVSGVGVFILDGAAHTTATTDNTSFLSVSAGGDVSIGNVDFSGYENDAAIDLSFTTSGAASIIGSGNDDIIVANDDDNVITGGDGQDDITLGAGDDTIVTSLGDSGKTVPTIDVITGWGDTDVLDFNTVAASASNYVEGSGSADLANFIANANSALNSTVKFFVDTFGGNTYVAVNTTSGDCEMIVELVGNQMAFIGFENIIA